MSKRGDEHYRRTVEMNAKLRDPKILKWWRQNEEKLYSTKFMPEYPLSERLPLLGNSNPNAPEILHRTVSLNQDDFDAMQEFNYVASSIVYEGEDLGFDEHEIQFIKLYWLDGIPVEDVAEILKTSTRTVYSMAKELEERIRQLRKDGIFYCPYCGKTKKKQEFISNDMCKYCSEKDWQEEDV